MIINHVMSQDIHSKIFDDIIAKFKLYSPDGFQHITSVEPINEADIWHYHRPHLEKSLKPWSVVTVHHDLRDTDPWLNMDKFIPIYKEANKIVCLNSSQDMILKKNNISKTVIVPHGYDKNIFKASEKNNNKNKINLLITSRRYPRRVKGESYIIELIKYLNPDVVSFTLVGQDRTIDKMYLERFGFESKIYEKLPYPLYGELYLRADFLLMTSYFEGGPANIPEAIASGTPVICNPVGMARDLVIDNYNGVWLTMSPEVDAFRLNEIFSTKSKLIEMQKNALDKKSIESAISWEESIIKNCAVYEDILK